jgi:hypothetical protein
MPFLPVGSGMYMFASGSSGLFDTSGEEDGSDISDDNLSISSINTSDIARDFKKTIKDFSYLSDKKLSIYDNILANACNVGHLKLVQLLLKHYVTPLNAQTKEKNTLFILIALHHSVNNDSDNNIIQSLRERIQPNCVEPDLFRYIIDLNTIIAQACKFDNIYAIKTLHFYKILSPHDCHVPHRELIYIICMFGNVSIMEYMVANQIIPQRAMRVNINAFRPAFNHGHIKMVEYLLDHVLPIGVILEGRKERLNALVTMGYSLESGPDGIYANNDISESFEDCEEYPNTLLWEACSSGILELIQLIIKKGGLASCSSLFLKEFEKAIKHAEALNHLDIVYELLSHAAESSEDVASSNISDRFTPTTVVEV